MSGASWIQFAVLIGIIFAVTPPLGRYIAGVFTSQHDLGPERWIYRLCGVDPKREQGWATYARSLLAFSFVSVLGLYLLQRVQGSLFLNPTHMVGVAPTLAWNTAVSFTTNTNWQNYAGESTMSHLTQMVGLGGAELRVGCRRPLRRHRARSEDWSAAARRRSATSGST